MSLFALLAVVCVCLAGLVLAVLVLSHLKALHLTQSQAVELKTTLGACYDSQQDAIRELARTVADLSAKHTALANRTR